MADMAILFCAAQSIAYHSMVLCPDKRCSPHVMCLFTILEQSMSYKPGTSMPDATLITLAWTARLCCTIRHYSMANVCMVAYEESACWHTVLYTDMAPSVLHAL